MQKLLLALAISASVLIAGCQQQPYYTQQQPTQPILAQTCTNPQGIVVADQYCDANWLAQQQMIAQQQNNTSLLTALLLYHSYHSYYSSEPYEVGMYMRPGSYYTTRPTGYVVQSRNTYVTAVHNHTIIVNNGRAVSAPRSSAPSPVRPRTTTAPGPFSRPTTSQRSTFSSPSRSAPSPFSRPSSSYSSRSSYSSSSSSRRR